MRSALEVADVFRRHGAAYRQTHAGHLSQCQRRVMAAIEACRTAALGGHVEQCDDCGQVRIAYNSCRNRHCPKCQGLARAEWLADRQAELLPVPYFHVVFTVPAPIAEIAFQNKTVVYGILFKAAAETLRLIAADPKHLGAALGSGRRAPHLGAEPAPSSASSLRRPRWWAICRWDTLDRLPARLLPACEGAVPPVSPALPHRPASGIRPGRLQFHADLADLAAPEAFAACLRPLRATPWVVFAKRPFGGPEQVLDYLGRYTHRVAITNRRLVGLHETRVSFLWKDYRHHDKRKVMTLDADEFIRRFLLHVLPDGFHRIRHYGYLANGQRAAKLALCRRLLAAPAPPSPAMAGDYRERYHQLTGRSLELCPCCGGRMVQIALIPRPAPPQHPGTLHEPAARPSPPSFPQRRRPSVPRSSYCVLPLAPAGIRAVHSSQPRRSPAPSSAAVPRLGPKFAPAPRRVTANRQRLGSSTKAAAKSP